MTQGCRYHAQEVGARVPPAPLLLPQTGGFEGFFGLEEGPHQNRLAVPELDHERRGELELGATLLAAYVASADRDEAVPQIPDLRDVDLELVESFVEVSEQLADAVVSPEHCRVPCEQLVHHRVPLDLGVECFQQRFDVSSVAR